jgi:ArsR family transcriptional regulator, arsenate/arsenite/antimonite-responsive transcriptional repressor
MEISLAIRSLAALAHEHRLGAFRLLVKAGEPGLAAGEIAAALELPPSSLSFHLAALEHAGLVSATRSGRFIHYRVEPAAISALLAYLTEDCCAGRPELCGGIVNCARETPAAPLRGRTKKVPA